MIVELDEFTMFSGLWVFLIIVNKQVYLYYPYFFQLYNHILIKSNFYKPHKRLYTYFD